MSNSRSTDDLMREMHQIRRELRDDVDGMVDRAQVMTDWRHYVKTYPLACIAVSAAAGYLLVPTRVKVIQGSGQEVASPGKASTGSKQEVTARGGMLSMVGGMVATALIQGASALARQQLQVLLKGTPPASRRASESPLASQAKSTNHSPPNKRQESN